jgi:hypothetical protein
MSEDIARILAEWEYEPDRITARIIPGDDGRDKVQLRLDLGLLQMELDGRPDGARPYGHGSLLEYHEAMADRHIRQYGSAESFALDSDDCEALQEEGVQYYHRYLALLAVGEFERAERDTARNLRLFDFVREHAANEEDSLAFEQYRPYVIMMNARAGASRCLREERYADALERIDGGVAKIEEFLERYGTRVPEERSRELTFLKRWREELAKQRPLTEEERLQAQLKAAVEAEDYDRAAELRDEIERLKGEG